MVSAKRAFASFSCIAAVIGIFLNSTRQNLQESEVVLATTATGARMTEASPTSSLPAPHRPFVSTAPCSFGSYPIPNVTHCVTFFPARFFSNDSNDTVFYDESFRHNQAVFGADGNPIIHMEPTDKAATAVPTSLSYLHVRKVGGSTMHWAFRPEPATATAVLLSNLPDMDKVTLSWYMRNHKMGDAAYNKAWESKLVDIVESQKAATLDMPHVHGYPAVVFTFVRCPVERYLSAIGQLLKSRPRFDRSFSECVDSSKTTKNPASTLETLQLVQCTLDILESSVDKNRHASFLDVHLEPQVYSMRAAVNSKDVAILLIDLSSISSVLQLLRPANTGTRRRKSTGNKYTGGYRLTTNILTRAVTQQICRIYATDVQLLRESSMVTTQCV